MIIKRATHIILLIQCQYKLDPGHHCQPNTCVQKKNKKSDERMIIIYP